MTPSELRVSTRRFNQERRRNRDAEVDFYGIVSITGLGMAAMIILFWMMSL